MTLYEERAAREAPTPRRGERRMSNRARCANCGDTIWQSVPNPSYWTHERNGSNYCPGRPMDGTSMATPEEG